MSATIEPGMLVECIEDTWDGIHSLDPAPPTVGSRWAVVDVFTIVQQKRTCRPLASALTH